MIFGKQIVLGNIAEECGQNVGAGGSLVTRPQKGRQMGICCCGGAHRIGVR